MKGTQEAHCAGNGQVGDFWVPPLPLAGTECSSQWSEAGSKLRKKMLQPPQAMAIVDKWSLTGSVLWALLFKCL